MNPVRKWKPSESRTPIPMYFASSDAVDSWIHFLNRAAEARRLMNYHARRLERYHRISILSAHLRGPTRTKKQA